LPATTTIPGRRDGRQGLHDADPRRIHSNDWLEQDGEVVLREWCVVRLEAVELTGSMSVAAASAWKIVEQHFTESFEPI
jgi:hypothetical protein